MILGMLGGLPSAPDGPLGALRYHRHIEAARLAYRDRDAFVADPSQVDVPVKKLLSAEYLAGLRGLIDDNKAMRRAAGGGRGAAAAAPRHRLSLRRRQGRQRVQLHQLAVRGLRLGILAERSGVMLQNRGFGFRVERGHPNCIAPRKRPMHTIIPGMVMKDGQAVMPYGVMGGHFQPMGHSLFLTNMLEYGLDIQEAIDLPRLFPLQGKVQVERGIPLDVVRPRWRASATSWRWSSGRMAAARRSGSTASAAAWSAAPSRARTAWRWGTGAMNEPCDLTAVVARRLIGQKKLAPSELMESCIARIEAVDHAVNAMVARDFDRARATAKAADAAVARGDDLPPLHGLPIGIKDLQETEGLRTTFGSPIFRDHVPTADERIVAAVRSAGAIVLGKTNTPEFGAGANTRNAVYGATGNPFDPTLSAAGSSGGSAVALATGMVPICSGSDTGGSLRNPAAFSGIVGFRPTPGLVANERRGLGWNNLSVAGPMARTVPDLCLLLSTMVSDDPRDPLATTVHGRTVRRPEDFAVPARIDLSRMRVAVTPDFGFAPTERHIAEVFAEKTGLFRHVFAHAEEATPDCTGADEAFEVLRAIGFLASHAEKVRTRPQDVGPNVRANVEEGQRYSAADVARAQTLQTMLYRRWQDFFRDKDVILTPSITISPRSWRELYPAEIDGKPTRTYFHWLALAYAVTLPGHPAVSLPVGLDRHGMPFGLQIVGPRGGDAFVLSVAAELEAMLAADARTARPVPDLARLKAARPISEMSGFLGFD